MSDIRFNNWLHQSGTGGGGGRAPAGNPAPNAGSGGSGIIISYPT